MTDAVQQVSPRGMRMFLIYVVIYLGIGSYMYFYMTLPSIAYVLYGIISWIAGMMLFYKLHKSHMAKLKEEQT